MNARESTPSRLSTLALFFAGHAGVWIDGREFATLVAAYAWRTRISDLRRAPHSMRLENRQRRFARPDGSHYVVSEYRFLPPATTATTTASDDDGSCSTWEPRP